VALSLRDCRDAMVDAGLAIADPVLAGGGLRSPLWRRIVVDCLGIPARTLAIQGPSIGAAMLAGASVGRPIPWVASGRRRPGRRIGPVAANVRAYDHLYGIYRDAVAASTEVSHQLARVQAAGSEAELEARSPRRDPG
jgi:sugar (pentulose or hexulose) kinase